MRDDRDECASAIGAVRHSSQRVWCAERGQAAAISVIERSDLPVAIRFVLWCSLRADAMCAEHCLRGAEAARCPRRDGH
jgi:hypothetical protein